MSCQVAAYYFPNYHPDARNALWHGTGWTEWDLVKTARPRYPGHQQPKVPAWGYFDEADPAWAAKEIDLAADHALSAFIYDWYWYEDGSFLVDGLEKGFLRAPNRHRLKFALMWANHDWTNIHPALYTNRPELQFHGAISPAAWDTMTDYIIDRYFSQPNYWTVDGKPYFSIYDLGRFVKSYNSDLAACADALESFRRKTINAGFPGLHLNTVVWTLGVLPSETKLDTAAMLRKLGLDSGTTYAWVHHYNPSAGGFPKNSYAAAAEANFQAWDNWQKQLGVPYHPNVSMGWDPSPRTVQDSPYENCGYPWTGILEGNTPAAFRAALEKAKRFADRHNPHQKIITLNAWNEWTEGSYLLPDTTHGNTYLEQIKSVFT